MIIKRLPKLIDQNTIDAAQLFLGRNIVQESASRLVFLFPVEKIIEAANKEDVGIIAMTSHGYGGLTRIFYGSVAAGILNRVDRPLFIVRSRWDE